MLGVAAHELDGDPPRPGGLDVLAQHILGMACSAPFHPDALFAEIAGTQPYAGLARATFDDVLGFVENGGYALAAYDRYRKLFRDAEGRIHVRSARVALQYRMNIGTIVEQPLVKVRLTNGRRFGPMLGEIEEYFVSMLRPGDTFMVAGRLLRFLRLHETVVEAAEGGTGDPMVPCAGCCKTRPPGIISPSPCRNGCACKRRARACPAATTCWWKPSRAATAGTWWPIASRAATRTRRSACC
jgi:ATP-dependent Lhr-like helicase